MITVIFQPFIFRGVHSLKLTAIAPKNRPSQKETIVFQPSIFRCAKCGLVLESVIFFNWEKKLESTRTRYEFSFGGMKCGLVSGVSHFLGSHGTTRHHLSFRPAQPRHPWPRPRGHPGDRPDARHRNGPRVVRFSPRKKPLPNIAMEYPHIP